MSVVMKENLPRPLKIVQSMFEDDLTEVGKLIQEEMLRMMVYDNLTYPLKKMKPSDQPTLAQTKTDIDPALIEKTEDYIFKTQGIPELDIS